MNWSIQMSNEAEVKEVETVVEPNPVEEQAREQGWVSKEEWTADGRNAEEWRPAKEFVERGEIFKSLHQVKRELKQEKAAREALQKHHQYVFEKSYQKALNDLRQERRQAMRDEDLAKVEEVEDKMAKVQQEYAQETQAIAAQVQTAAAANGVQPEFQEWVNRNQWFTQDNDMREFAEAVGLIYIQKNPSSPPAEVLKHVESKVRKQYSEKFGARKAAPNAVAGVDRTAQRKTSGADLIMDEMEIQIMKTLVSNGDMTEEQYKSELKKAKGL
jgi:hypothetical protein